MKQGDTKVNLHIRLDKIVPNFPVDLKRNLQFRPKNVDQKHLSTLKNSTLSRPPPLKKFDQAELPPFFLD